MERKQKLKKKVKCTGNIKDSTACMICPACAESVGTIILLKYKHIVDAGVSEDKANLLDRIMQYEKTKG